MAQEKQKCSKCNLRDATHKGLCSGCYGKAWREKRKAERVAEEVAAKPPKQLTSGVTGDELEVIEGEIIHDHAPPETHLVATSPLEMQAAQGDLKAWLEQRLTILERDIVEANRALEEARKNGWATVALVHARNRAVDDETFYNKILMAVEAGHTIIPDFPIQVFAVRAEGSDKAEQHTWTGHVNKDELWLSKPAQADCLPAGAGEYRNPLPEVQSWSGFKQKNAEGKEYIPYTVRRTGRPVGPIVFPSTTARSPIMRATAAAMSEKTFDQIGVCLPVQPDAGIRRARENAGRAGDPLVIGQVLRKRTGSVQRAVSFIIAWYLNLDEL